MAAGNASKLLRIPGKVIVNPTEEFLGGTYPYGGTEVGFARQATLRVAGTEFLVEYESLGEIGDVLNHETVCVFSCLLRGWDDDAVELLFADGYAAGAVSQHAVYSIPAAVPGTSGLDTAVKLAFVPEDPIHSPGILVYRGVPMWTESADLAFQRGTEFALPLTVQCIRDTSDRIAKVGRIVDLPVV